MLHMSSVTEKADPLPYFLSTIDRSGGPDACWPWRGARTKDGYGRLVVWGKTVGAHRYAFEVFRRVQLGRLMALHHCDNPPCCNPAHLYAGTAADNIADMIRRGRQGQADGPSAMLKRAYKMTPASVLALREESARGVPAKDLAKRYGLSVAYTYNIIKGRQWVHLATAR